MSEYILNAAVELSLLGEDRFEVQLQLWGRSLEASRYQAGLLEQFESPVDPSEVLSRFPFERAESERFLERCIAQGVLLPLSPEGAPIWPARSQVRPSMLNAPPFEPADPAGFVFLGVPLDINTSGAPGARFGPSAVRQAAESCRYTVDPKELTPRGIHDYSSGRTLLKGVRLQDAGDVFVSPGEQHDALYDRITGAVFELIDAGAIPLLIGGDHSITYPALRAFPGEPLCLIHLDAHTDLGDLEPGGLHHGNVFSVILRKLEFIEHIYQFGLRGLLEAAAHEETTRVTSFGMDRLRSEGAQALVRQLPPERAYYLTIDIDVLDPAFAPSTGTPVPNGLFPHELKALVRAITEQREVIGVDVVEVAQPSSPFDSTAGLAVETLLTAADGILQRMIKIV